MAPVQYREYLEQQYAYSAYTMATESAAIFVMNNEKNEDLLYEDFTTMKSMHFGMVKYNSSSFTNEFIDNYSVRNNFMPDNITYYNNMTELLAALEKGDIEAAVANILFTNEKYKMVGRFSPMTSYYIMQKNNNGLKDELDEAMSSIVLSDPGYQAELMSDYFQFYGISSFTYDNVWSLNQTKLLRYHQKWIQLNDESQELFYWEYPKIKNFFNSFKGMSSY